MLDFFMDETGNGLLFINYPMVESLRYTKELPDNNYWTYTVTRKKCKEEKFKHQVHEFSFYQGNLEHIIVTIKPADDEDRIMKKKDMVKKNWRYLIVMNNSKANYICNGKNEIPDEMNNQNNIFYYQLTKYVETEECKVAILNAFPIFLYYYFGKKIIDGL